MFQELGSFIAAMANPHLKALLEAVFADEALALAYRTAPAAKSVHHAWLGGLIEHVLSLCHLAKFAATHYPGIDFDLLLTGVVLHDIGKTRELNYTRGFSYSTEGQLLGHIVIGMNIVDEKLRQVPDFPRPLRDLVMHMILSHHGQLEFGSPKVPMFAEALLLHHLDNLDSKIECVRGLVERDRLIEGEWTGYSSALDRSLLKKSKFLEPDGAGPVTDQAQDPPKAAAPALKSPEPKRVDLSSPFAAKLHEALGRKS
ncbi:MAG TPA: HD domain-containing protein, partial [Bryobacteraceae bacterium]|nr:HD domain-containing protein [Bryobacteraceae bacterium]